MAGYEGKVVLANRKSPSKDYSSYYDGEYLIVAESPFSVIGVCLAGGGLHSGIEPYALSRLTTLAVEGPHAYHLSSPRPAPAWVVKELDRVERSVDDAIDGKIKANWAIHVYHSAKSNIHRIREALGVAPVEVTVEADSLSVDVPSGTKRVLLNFT